MVASDRAHITLFVKLFDTLALQVIRLAARPRAGVGRERWWQTLPDAIPVAEFPGSDGEAAIPRVEAKAGK